MRGCRGLSTDAGRTQEVAPRRLPRQQATKLCHWPGRGNSAGAAVARRSGRDCQVDRQGHSCPGNNKPARCLFLQDLSIQSHGNTHMTTTQFFLVDLCASNNQEARAFCFFCLSIYQTSIPPPINNCIPY